MATIFVLNPNSSVSVTQAMDDSLAPARAGLPHVVRCGTLAEGPSVIESEEDGRMVVPHVAARVAREAADAYVVACFSDPGLAEARSRTDKPVVGIGEAGYLAAIALAPRFGVVSILEPSIARHARHIERLGLTGRLAADRAIGFGVASLAGADALAAIVAVGRRLRDEDGAGAIVLGCAGMGRHRPAAEDALGIPVVDPVQAAVMLAGTLVTLGYRVPRA